MQTIDLKIQDLNKVCQILQNHVPNYPVWAFGSRVNGKAKTYSDLDLAIITQQPLSLSTMAQLKEAFDESNLPIRVDIVDWGDASEVFQKIILKNNVPIQNNLDCMQTAKNIKSQNGAVLAFSLVMLLLLTLAATRMIQQNKQQLEMANNARLMTQEFANAEGVLAEAENLLETHPAHNDPTTSPAPAIFADNHQCTPIATVFKQQIVLAGTVLVNKTLENGTVLKAEITEAACSDKNGGLIKICTSYNSATGVVTCNIGSPSTDCTGKTISEVAALFPEGEVCYQHYDPNCDDDAYYNAHGECTIKPPKCPVQTYKIRAISTSRGVREIVRGKQIKCGTL